MFFDSLSAALAMDGHGGFVWGAYAVTAIVLALLLLTPARRRKRLLREIAGEVRRASPGRQGRGNYAQPTAHSSTDRQP